MEHAFLDKYAYQTSPIHRLNPTGKLIATLALVFATALLPVGATVALCVAWAIALVAYASARLPARLLVTRLAMVAPFPLVISVVYAFGSPPGSRLSLFSFFFLKSLACVAFLLTLISTTPFPDLLAALARLRAPSIVLSTLSFFYRYVFVLQDEFERSLRARALRARPDVHPLWQRSTFAMAGNIALRSFERSERVFLAMKARGYDSSRTLVSRARISRTDGLVVAMALVALVLIVYLAAAVR